jgi:hypothetical protein
MIVIEIAERRGELGITGNKHDMEIVSGTARLSIRRASSMNGLR